MKIGLIALSLLVVLPMGVVAQDAASEQEVLQIETLRRGQFATVRAEVVRINDEDEMIVRDETGRLRIYVPGVRGLRRLVSQGDILTITGQVDDDLIDVPLELYAERIVRADGTVIEVPRSERWD